MKDDNESARVHHPFSPSTLQNLEQCPCYIGKDSQHVRAIAGTLAHKVMETGEDDQKLDDNDSLNAAECMDFCESRKVLFDNARVQEIDWVAEHFDDHPDAVAANVPEVIELKETYLPIDDLLFDDPVPHPSGDKWKDGARRVVATTAGYIDRALISHDGTYAELLDWKFGIWPVEKAENNLQGIAYCLGLFKAYPKLKIVRFFFKQPAIGLLTSAAFTREQIPALYLRVQVVVAKARDARAKNDFSAARPAVPVCNFCALIGCCPKVAEFACRVGSKFYPLEIPAEITPTMVQGPHQTSLGMRLAAVMLVWAAAFKTQTTDRVLRGAADLPDGYEIQSKTSPREIIDMKKYREIAAKFLTDEEIAPALRIALGDVEDAIQLKAPRGQKKAQTELFKQELEESGATKKGEPYSFLRVANKTE